MKRKNQVSVHAVNFFDIPKILKRHRTIGIRDFSYMCKVTRDKSTKFSFIITYEYPETLCRVRHLSQNHASFEEMPHGDFIAHLGFSHNAS